jgi:hypothetical protein
MDRISFTILILILALGMHLGEEIKSGFREKFPVAEIPRALFIGIDVSVFGFCFSTLFL